MPINPHHAVFAGSFDPVTLGHLDIIQRGSRLFSKLTIGVGFNPNKQAWFSPSERVSLIKEAVAELPNVEVASFEGLTVEFLQQRGASVLLRSMRTLTDMEIEFTMTLANRVLAPEIETVFLMASMNYSHISSSLIKQVAQLGGNSRMEQLQQFVPEGVITALLAKTERHP